MMVVGKGQDVKREIESADKWRGEAARIRRSMEEKALLICCSSKSAQLKRGERVGTGERSGAIVA